MTGDAIKNISTYSNSYIHLNTCFIFTKQDSQN